VAASDGKLQVYQLLNDQRAGVGPETSNELKRMIAFGQDEREYLKFPLAVGLKWTVNYLHRSPGRTPRRRYIDFKITGLEEITTSAGTFRAYRIEGSATFVLSSRTVHQQRIIHYSPDTKSIVSFYYDSAIGEPGAKVEIKLKKFTPKGKDVLTAK